MVKNSLGKKSLTISIQQPEFLPWIGFFNKIANVDEVVLLDSVQFKKRYFENRVRIRNTKGWQWLRIPVKTKGKYLQRICDVEIDNSFDWRADGIRSIELNYKKAPYFGKYSGRILGLFEKDWKMLSNFNVYAIKTVAEILKINSKFQLASDLKVSGKSAGLILNICKSVKAKKYLSGQFGKEYLDEELFKKEKIDVIYQEFKHPAYKQFQPGFVPNMSIIDLLFNVGDASMEVIKSGFLL